MAARLIVLPSLLLSDMSNVQLNDEHFSDQYGFWRPYIQRVIHRYLDCGDLHNGFARVMHKDCGHEYFLAFSCKRIHYCPSCHQKRAAEFGEWLCMDVLKKVPHRHFVFSIPKILRWYLQQVQSDSSIFTTAHH